MKETEIKVIELTLDNIESMIYVIRGQRVMLDFDLAKIYGYETKRFNEQVKNNISKFPKEFMFSLEKVELNHILRSKKSTANIISSKRRYNPYAFTEQGIYMLMTVLKGELATKQSIALIKAFKEMKDYLVSSNSLSTVNELIKLTSTVNKHDEDIKDIKNQLTEVMDNFIDPSTYKHFLILDGKRFEADIAYQKIYSLAKRSVVIVDDYISIKTLQLLKATKSNIKVIIISDNKAKDKVEDTYLEDFKKEASMDISIINNNKRFHDRYIFIDYKEDKEYLYHCGTSSKDAGNKITTIMKIDNTTIYHSLFEGIINK